MKPAPFAYVRPASLAEALEALAAHADAKVLAGGQSLVPMLSMRLARPAVLVDIGGISELAHVTTDDAGVRVGALARHADVEHDEPARRAQPLLARALRLVAHPTIRNRGTTVGSLVHADPSAEMPAVLALLGGEVSVASVRGRRTVPAAELVTGPMETSLAADELAVEALFPALPGDAGVACDEVARRHGDYALCGVAAEVRLDRTGQVTSVRAAYFSVADVPTVLDLSEVFAAGEVTRGALEDAGALALEQLEPAGDIHATASYRGRLVRVLTARVVGSAFEDARARRGVEVR